VTFAPFLCATFAVLWVSSSTAAVTYRTEDKATVRVFAVRGVDEVDGKTEKGATLHIAAVEAGHGSGAILTEDGVVLTAQHVIDDAEFVAVSVPGDATPKMAQVIYQSRRADVAFLKIPGHYENRLPLPPTDPELTVRQTLFALGYPLDGSRQDPQSTAGVLSAALPNGRIQLSMAVNPGNSGGPVIDETGRLIGIIVERADPTAGAQGIAIAVPVSTIQGFYDRGVKDSAAYKSAVANESKLANSGGAALVISEIASVSSLGAAIEHIEHMKKDFTDALVTSAKSHAQDPDYLALLASHYYNEALIFRHLNGKDWVKPLATARTLARSAFALDPRVSLRSPFLVRLLTEKGAKAAGGVAAKPPRRIMGMKLGSALGEAEAACVVEGLTFTKTAKGYQCSEPPDSESMTGPVDIRVCAENRVCRIDVVHRPSKALAKVWVDAYEYWLARMRARYGEPTSNVVKMPPTCRKNLLECLEKGEALLSYTWKWTGQKLILGLGRLDGQPTLRLSIVEDGVSSAAVVPATP
jgi:hypothetical protein